MSNTRKPPAPQRASNHATDSITAAQDLKRDGEVTSEIATAVATTSATLDTPRSTEPDGTLPHQNLSSSLPSAPTEDQVRAGEPAMRFPALRHRNFRLFWTGNLISLVGTLAQQTAQGWLVRTLTHDPFIISTVAACGSAPILLLTLYAGVVADRIDKRRALLFFNSISALLALVLAVLVWTGVVRVWHVALVSLGVGAVNAFDIPVRQSFNIEMVGREDLPNAIALNSTAFNTARVAGPAVGGFLLRTVGMAGCFFINALSFLSILIGLFLMRLPPSSPVRQSLSLQDFKEGLRFVRHHSTLWLLIVLVAFVSIFALSFSTLLPVFAKDVFHTDERGFSTLMTCNGIGALGSAISLAVVGKMRHKGKRQLYYRLRG